jgi:hypothetical protein
MKVENRRKIFVLLFGIIILGWAITMFGCCCPPCEPTAYYSPNGKPFPTKWGKPPEIQTKDYRLLPYGYGHGSSTLYSWIILNRNEEQICWKYNWKVK